jgi:hypothetical protein
VTKFMINKDGATFYLNGNTWFRPAYGRKRSLLHFRFDSLTRRRAIVQGTQA